jgi:hypothetical protein
VSKVVSGVPSAFSRIATKSLPVPVKLAYPLTTNFPSGWGASPVATNDPLVPVPRAGNVTRPLVPKVGSGWPPVVSRKAFCPPTATILPSG